jgi:hypothetical protein
VNPRRPRVSVAAVRLQGLADREAFATAFREELGALWAAADPTNSAAQAPRTRLPLAPLRVALAAGTSVGDAGRAAARALHAAAREAGGAPPERKP